MEDKNLFEAAWMQASYDFHLMVGVDFCLGELTPEQVVEHNEYVRQQLKDAGLI